MASMASMVAEGEEGSRLLLTKPCKCEMQPSSETAAHVRPDEINMFTGNAAKSTTCINTEKIGVSTEEWQNRSIKRKRDGKSRVQYILDKRTEITSSELPLSILF